MVAAVIELYSANQMALLPNDWLSGLLNFLYILQTHSFGGLPKKRFRPIVTHLHHSVKVIWPSGTFVRPPVLLPY